MLGLGSKIFYQAYTKQTQEFNKNKNNQQKFIEMKFANGEQSSPKYNLG
jgi:hypothetical protein